MTALTHEQARRYLHLGTPELTPAEIADLVGHLAACHECRTYAARLEALRPELAAVLHTRWDTLHPPVGLPRTIARRARRDTMKRQTISYASAAVGVIALLVFFILFRFVIPRQSAHPNTTTIPQATMLSTQSPPTEVASSIPSPTFSAQPASSTPIFTPTPPPTPEPTDTLTPAPSITPSNTPAAMAICPSIKPIAQAPMLWGASFLPDGQWITYWAASQEAIAQAEYEMPVGVLHFINLQTGQACMRPEFTTEAGKPLLGWSVDGDGQVTVITDQGTYRGLPCQTEPFMQVSQQTKKEVIAASSTLPPDYSPDGKYQVKTESLSIENDIEKFDTTIIAVNSGEVVQHLTWLIDTGTGSYENVTGGMWISNSQFLIDRTFDRGPLIVDAAKGVIQVLTDLLGMQEIPSPVDGEFYIPWGIPLPGDKPDQYHLLVVGAWPEADSPTVSLYHAESGVVETLPYSQPWYGGFSPDHQWLMMDRHPDVNGYEAFEVWIRRLEDVDGKWQLLADPSIVEYSALWNSNYTEMVVNKEDRLTWQPFPDPNYGERLGCWQTTGYWTLPDAFSLDGCRVLATGNKPGEWDYGLFVLDRCQTIPKLPELSQTQDFTTLAEAQFAARFTLLAPSFVPEGLMLNKVSVNDYADGSQTVFIAYAEDFTGEKPDANVKGMLIRLTIGSSLITMDSLTSIFKETVLDILSVTVRGQVGYTYWMPAVAAGNSAWLAWNEGDLTITITLYGNWPQPTEDDPHGLDETLLQIAESLK